MIPHSDEHKYTPSRRVSEHMLRLHQQAFFINRDKAFSCFMSLDLLIPFFRRNRIPYPNPEDPEEHLHFWLMCYTAIVTTGAGGEASVTRANIWLGGMRYRFAETRRDSKGYVHFDWDATGSYTLYGKVHLLHPLLSLQRPKV